METVTVSGYTSTVECHQTVTSTATASSRSSLTARAEQVVHH